MINLKLGHIKKRMQNSKAISLNEEYLKTRLIDYLLSNVDAVDILASEVPFADFRRRADILLINKQTHAYEVKSEIDNLNKLEKQLLDYQRVFDKVSVAVTRSHLSGVRKLLHPSVGIILIEPNKIKKIREAKSVKRLKKYWLACFLSVKEIRKFIRCKNLPAAPDKGANVDELRRYLSNQLTTNTLRELMLNSLKQKYETSFKYFRAYRGEATHPEDIMMLSNRIKILVKG